MTNVFENSQKLVVENAKEKSFISPQAADDLTKIKGIGLGTALKLNNANFYTFKQLADISPDILSEIPGISDISAYKFITGAKNLLGEFPDENSFKKQNQVLEKAIEIVKKKKETEVDNIETFEVAELIVEEEFPQEEFQREEKPIETTQEQLFNDKFNYSRLTASYPPLSERPSEESKVEIEENEEQSPEQIDTIFNEESFVVEKPESLEENSREETSFVPEINEIFEVVNEPQVSRIRNAREEIKTKIEVSLKNSGYYEIPNTISTLNPFVENVDYVGCKLVRVSKGVNHIFIIPIKIFDLEGTVLVDEAKLDYNTGTNDSKTESMSRLRYYYKNLLNTRDLMFDDIVNDKKFRAFFQKYLQVNLTLEKSVENKKLFFMSGQTQYKVLIEPIMLCKTTPRCMEKTIPFPYQRNSNLHIIHQSNLSQLLDFLEQKYRLIESRLKSSNTIKNYQKMDEKFRTNVRFASIPLVGYAIVLAVIYFAELFFLLRLFNSIGFAIMGIYLSLLAYLYFKFYRTKQELAIEFETPYYMQNLEFSEIDLLEFKDQFNTENMAQFGYECFGKGKYYKVLEEIEEHNFKNSVLIKQKELEPQVIHDSKEEIEESVSIDNSKYNNKYISFLED